jgi:hypothetical protein
MVRICSVQATCSICSVDLGFYEEIKKEPFVWGITANVFWETEIEGTGHSG